MLHFFCAIKECRGPDGALESGSFSARNTTLPLVLRHSYRGNTNGTYHIEHQAIFKDLKNSQTVESAAVTRKLAVAPWYTYLGSGSMARVLQNRL